MGEAGRIGEIQVEPTNDGGIAILLYDANESDPSEMLEGDMLAFTVSIERAVMLMAQIEEAVMEAQARSAMLNRAVIR
jgi:hypothetical protein